MARIRLFLLAVMCWLCLVPAAHAIRPQTPAELQLKGETPGQQPLAYWSESMLDGEVRNGLFCVNNPLRYTDPSGHFVPVLLAIAAMYIATESYANAPGPGDSTHSQWESTGNPLGFIDAPVGMVRMPLEAGAAKLPMVLGKEAEAGAVAGAGKLAQQGVKAGTEAAASAEKAAATAKTGTETVQRAMSKAELKATQDTGLLRGGREGTAENPHFASDAVNSDAKRAQQRLALPKKPEVKVTMETPTGTFSSPSKVEPKNGMPGGGTERTATGKVPVKITNVDKY